ncbi:MAG: 3'-5' exonuclease [Gammaproteobacteria bacterium]|nr:3'-5' exonuclease [Gammaproteobacteria bacterium]
MNVFVFDIETVPDVVGGRKLYDLHDLSDEEVVLAMQAIRRQETQGTSDFIRLHLQRVVCISGVLRTRDQFKVWSLGEPQSSEAELIERFFSGLEKLTPTLVSWNGNGFDLPVLHYRAMVNGVSAGRYWEMGEHDNSFKFNNYLNRYHYRHMDIMDILSSYQSRACAPLDDIAVLLGFPGKMGMSGGKVWESFLKGDIEKIRNYCETDVLNTYLVFLRFELMRGKLSQTQYEMEVEVLKEHLRESGKPHLIEFLEHLLK